MKMLIEKQLNENDTIKHWNWLQHKNESEIRIISKDQKESFSVFVHNESELLEIVKKYFSTHHIYIGINERKHSGTKISDIETINNIVVDADVKSVKDSESALIIAKQIAKDYLHNDYKTPLLIFSGKGYHLYFAIEPIPNTEENRVKLKEFGKSVKEKYETELVNIDLAVYEPARIMRLAGTWNVKEGVEQQAYIVNQNDKRVNDEKLTAEFLNLDINKAIEPVNCKININDILDKDKNAKDLFEGNVIIEKRPDEFPKDKRLDRTELLKFKTRSDAEQSLVCRLVSLDLNKEEIYTVMKECKLDKWRNEKISYKDLTYSTAINLVTQRKIIIPTEIDKSKLNLIDDERIDSWTSAKKYMAKALKERNGLYFFIHNKDTIKGKPILLYNTMQKLKLVSRVKCKDKDNKEIEKIKFIDEHTDKRSESEIEDIHMNLWMYRVINSAKEYIVLSKNELSDSDSLLRGMVVELMDLTDIGKNLKVSKTTPVFFVQSTEPSTKLLEKKELIEYCKKIEWNIEMFRNMIFLHDDGCIYYHPEIFESLISTFLLSGKYNGYPLHLLVMGPPGSGKTTLEETLASKFNESQGIFEAGNSTMKGLVPSFKESPANLGYLLNCSRLALVDELMKCVDNAKGQRSDLFQTQFGQFNMLLEHKKRMIGSGSTGNFIAHATAKFLFVTNPSFGRTNISQQAMELDRTTLSRMLIWVQDREHQNKILQGGLSNKKRVFPEKEKDIDFLGDEDEKIEMLKEIGQISCYKHKESLNFGIIPKTIYKIKLYNTGINNNNNIDIVYGLTLNFFLTIFDSCNRFLCDFSEKEVEKVFRRSLNAMQDPMLTVWKARGLHHSVLLLDGIIKERCLFKDNDETFTAKEEDYQNMEKMLNHMIKSWNTDFAVYDDTTIIKESLDFV